MRGGTPCSDRCAAAAFAFYPLTGRSLANLLSCLLRSQGGSCVVEPLARGNMARLGGLIERTILVVILGFFMGAVLPAVNAQAPAPAPSPDSGDGHAIDQGIAYVLLFLALVLTYLIHPLDAFPSFF